MSNPNPETKTGSSSSKPPTNGGGPIIKESQESEEYQEDLKVVLGTAFGVIVVVGLVVVGLLLYRVYKARQRALAYTANDAESIDRNISLDIDGKSQSVLLILYSYDCLLHRRVVEALAGFLMEVCGVIVTLDILEEAEIVDRGVDDWLVDRLQESDYIMVVCSLGGRLRCSKKHVRFKHPEGNKHVLPDYFALAVDYVSEKMRVERQKGLSTDKFLVAFMEYSTRSDIPPQLETARQFCLMKDIHKLHTHLNAQGPESDKSDSGSHLGGGGGDSGGSGGCESFYHETETGALLKATIEQAVAYFEDNPSWMADSLEEGSAGAGGPVSSRHAGGRGGKHRKRHHRSSIEQPLLVLTGSSAPWNQNSVVDGIGETKHDSRGLIYEGDYGHSSAVDLSNSCSVPPLLQTTANPDDGVLLSLGHSNCGVANRKTLSSNLGICQNRQNSLPSSLAGSGLLLPHHPSPGIAIHGARTLTSKSMDSFCTDLCLSRPDHEGVPCLFCGNCHMDGLPECRHRGGGRKARTSSDFELSQQQQNYQHHHQRLPFNDDNNRYYQQQQQNRHHSQDSLLHATNTINDGAEETMRMQQHQQGEATPHFSRSQTVLHAEVHQEWGTPVRDGAGTSAVDGGKGNTFGGDNRHAHQDPPPAVAFKSLPPHCPAPKPSSSMITEWQGIGGTMLRRWQSGMPDSPDFSGGHVLGKADAPFRTHDRRLSQTSSFTDESSGSLSDTDSLERDLRSIQNISSFHDFVNSSSFVSRSTAHFWQEMTPVHSLSLCHPLPATELSKPTQGDVYKFSGSGADIEMTQLRNSHVV